MDQYGSVFEVCIKWTTKKQLSEEKHGTEYYFKSNEEFQYVLYIIIKNFIFLIYFVI